MAAATQTTSAIGTQWRYLADFYHTILCYCGILCGLDSASLSLYLPSFSRSGDI